MYPTLNIVGDAILIGMCFLCFTLGIVVAVLVMTVRKK